MPVLNQQTYTTSDFYPYERLTTRNIIAGLPYIIVDEGVEHKGTQQEGDNKGEPFTLFVHTVKDSQSGALFSVKENKTSIEAIAKVFGWDTKLWVGKALIFTAHTKGKFEFLSAQPLTNYPPMPQATQPQPVAQFIPTPQAGTLPSYQPKR